MGTELSVPMETVVEIPLMGSASQLVGVRRKEERWIRAMRAALCLLLLVAKGATQLYLRTAARKCSAGQRRPVSHFLFALITPTSTCLEKTRIKKTNTLV